MSEPWFFGALGRDESVEILLKNGNLNGCDKLVISTSHVIHWFCARLFLVRESTNCPGAFVLTMTFDGRARHFQIQQVMVTIVSKTYLLVNCVVIYGLY